jgi:hypothetical protein
VNNDSLHREAEEKMQSFLLNISNIQFDLLTPEAAVSKAVEYKKELEKSQNPHLREIFGEK